MKLDKKAYSAQIFIFFFLWIFICGLLMFLSFGLHYIFFDYGISEAGTIGKNLISPYDPSAPAIAEIEKYETGFLGLTNFYDILFLVMMLSLFIESTIAAVAQRQAGFFSFFGFITIGNVFLITILSYAIQVRGWFLSEVVYEVILVTIDAPIMTFFFNYSMYIGILWYAWLIAVNQIDLPRLKALAQDTINKFGGKEKEQIPQQPDLENYLQNIGRGGQ